MPVEIQVTGCQVWNCRKIIDLPWPSLFEAYPVILTIEINKVCVASNFDHLKSVHSYTYTVLYCYDHEQHSIYFPSPFLLCFICVMFVVNASAYTITVSRCNWSMLRSHYQRLLTNKMQPCDNRYRLRMTKPRCQLLPLGGAESKWRHLAATSAAASDEWDWCRFTRNVEYFHGNINVTAHYFSCCNQFCSFKQFLALYLDCLSFILASTNISLIGMW